MLAVISAGREIAACQRKLQAAVRRATTERHRHVVGFPGGTFEADVCYLKKLDFWMAFENWGDRFCNACGIGYPFKGSPAPHLEINPPTKGVNRRTAGAFVKDEDGNYYLAHSGKVGGGTTGVSPANFRAYYPAHSIVDWGGVQRPAYIISAIDDNGLVEAVRDIVLISKQFREAIKAGLKLKPSPPTLDSHKFSPEFEGAKMFTTREQVVAIVRHGKVVKGLREALEGKGLDVANTINRDLYVHDHEGRTRALFEVKTTSDTTSVYGAIGQLFFHAEDGVMRVAVLPADIAESKAKRLEELGVSILKYSWASDGVAKFHEFEKLARELRP
jgi:hypothetical protein